MMILYWRAGRFLRLRVKNDIAHETRVKTMPTRYIYSFSEPLNPEELHLLFRQTNWADTRSPLDIQLMLDRSQITLGVWDEDHLIGFARVITDDLYRAVIDDVVVDRAYRHQGIASQMLKKILKRTEHIEVVMLDCGEELIGFYDQFGFKPKDGASMQLRNTR